LFIEIKRESENGMLVASTTEKRRTCPRKKLQGAPISCDLPVQDDRSRQQMD
jgi:hypothetical protein